MDLTIGELARRTGMSVKTIRAYSDRGIVPPARRTTTGHRRYGEEAVARLALVRTLRELGVDLATVRRVVAREVPLAGVAAAHVAAVDVQIRLLYLRRAVLARAARHGSDPEEMMLVHALATLSAEERRRLVDDFLDDVFAGLDAPGGFAGIRRSLTPYLPDDATADQIDAWVELATLARDPDFRATMRHTAREYAAGRGPALAPDVVAVVRAEAGPLTGTDPAAASADPVVAGVVARYAEAVGGPDDAGLRRRLLAHLRTVGDPRRGRYLRMLAVVNGWPAGGDDDRTLDWFTRALAART
ncbi:helix-turn-helix domain-containing protein [Actinocatenispora rupis]|uniref:MerR family transcriptional regulator n=1 Tax=Actinocatenispora rupis TaxID=519421 RepID=A0A8J3J9C1_9ACTN|nr:MerR family transcriptional regulator [Actinocatenispora rupis]GID14252.1 MerR family transcriptional regulator [Actinocatenispora rupis]